MSGCSTNTSQTELYTHPKQLCMDGDQLDLHFFGLYILFVEVLLYAYSEYFRYASIYNVHYKTFLFYEEWYSSSSAVDKKRSVPGCCSGWKYSLTGTKQYDNYSSEFNLK